MDKTPSSLHDKYVSLGILGYLVGAIDYATQQLRNVTSLAATRKGESGDIITELDRTVHQAVIDYFSENGIRVNVLGEEGNSTALEPQFSILLDEIEGTQNAVNGLDYGINIAIAPYKTQLKVKDLEAAVVVNLKANKMYVGEKGKGAYKIVNGERAEIVRKETDVYEVPSSHAYITTHDQRNRQEILAKIFSQVLGNQPRSVDATGTRLVELIEGNIRAYGDWRHATKCWDVLPSALILQEAGFKITDVLGFEFDEAILYDEHNPQYGPDGGLNRRIGENFIAASPSDHQRLIFGDEKSPVVHFLQYSFISERCIWDLAFKNKGNRTLPIRLSKFYNDSGDELSASEVEEKRREYGQQQAEILAGVIAHRAQAYGAIDDKNSTNIIDFCRNRYIVKLMKDFRLAEGLSSIHVDAFNAGFNAVSLV